MVADEPVIALSAQRLNWIPAMPSNKTKFAYSSPRYLDRGVTGNNVALVVVCSQQFNEQAVNPEVLTPK